MVLPCCPMQEVEAMRGGEKKAHTQRSAVEVRLNRALEEIERHKAEIASLRSQSEVGVAPVGVACLLVAVGTGH